MKVSKFIFQTKYEETGELLIYNTLNSSMLAIEPEYQNELQELLSKKDFIESDTELAKGLYSEGFLIDDDFDEYSVVLERSRLGIKDGNRLDVMIMPNMNCNFSCVYCYEDHHKSNMLTETEDSLLVWLENMVPRFKTVLISWFGGEPLISYDTIVKIQSKIIEICKRNDVELSSHITTNGYLLNLEKINKLIELDIYSYQITLDGLPETHDEMRPLKGGGSTFEKIFNNICLIARANPITNIKLRVNYDNRNVGNIRMLLEMFPEDVRKNCLLICERIFGKDYGIFDESSKTHGEIINDIYNYAKDLGFQVADDDVQNQRLTYCYADRTNQFLFNYNGDVFKCTVGKFKTQDRLGYLNNEGKILWEDNRLNNWHEVSTFEEKCYSCTFMPMCMGGCRKIRHLYGAVGDDCKLPFQGFDKKIKNLYTRELENS